MSDSSVGQLLADARSGQNERLGQLLQTYRNYLTILASTQINGKLRRRVSPSDVVQEAMLAAHRDFEKFRGSTTPEFLAWLRQVLLNTVHHAVDAHLRAQRRDVRREVSLEQSSQPLDQSAAKLANVLADPGPSPSTPAREHETAVRVADKLAQLRPQHRDVIVLRTLQGLPFDEVAKRMDRSPGAVRMLWLRAIDRFRQIYERNDGQ